METMATISSYVVDIGVSAIKEKIKCKQEEVALRRRLKDYLVRQNKYNFCCTTEEEIDFHGLAEYICGDFLEEVKQRLFGNILQRRLARQVIMDKASEYARAKTCISDKRARQLISNSIDILRRFYRVKVNRELKFMAAEIEDTIIDEMTTQHQSLEKTIEKTTLLSIDQSISHIQTGDFDFVEKNITTYFNALGTTHTLYPDFSFGYNEQRRLVSIPLSDDALKRYPPHLSISAKSIKLGDESLTEINDQVLLQSYRHQIPILLDDVTAEQYLGDIRDPIQAVALEVTGAHVKLSPPEFPKAFSCNVIIDDNVVIDYLLLRIKEILDDDTYIITNDEQSNFSFKVKISVNRTSHQFSVSVAPNNPTNYAALQYLMFLKKASEAHKIVLKALAENRELLSVEKINPIDFDNLNFEIELLKKIVAIEKFWDTNLCIPHEIQPMEYDLINHLYSMINNGIYQGTREYFIFTFALSKPLRESINNSKSEKIYSPTYTDDISVSLFNQTIKFPLLRRIDGAKIDHLEELKEKIASLDDGAEIKIKYIPAGQNEKMTYYDAILSEQAMQKIMDLPPIQPKV